MLSHNALRLFSKSGTKVQHFHEICKRKRKKLATKVTSTETKETPRGRARLVKSETRGVKVRRERGESTSEGRLPPTSEPEDYPGSETDRK